MNFDPARHIKRIGPLSVLFVMATEQEYGEHLRARIEPLITGVGPVEGGVATTHALAVLKERSQLPNLMVSLGSAGSRTLEHAEVYQITHVSYRDMDASALGFEKGVTPFLDLPAVVELVHRIPGVPEATLSTGGNIVSGAAYDGIAADMVDMETFAKLRAAQRFGVPLMSLRGVSDGKAELTGIHDWTEYLHIIDEKLARALDRLAEHAEAGGFR